MHVYNKQYWDTFHHGCFNVGWIKCWQVLFFLLGLSILNSTDSRSNISIPLCILLQMRLNSFTVQPTGRNQKAHMAYHLTMETSRTICYRHWWRHWFPFDSDSSTLPLMTMFVCSGFLGGVNSGKWSFMRSCCTRKLVSHDNVWPLICLGVILAFQWNSWHYENQRLSDISKFIPGANLLILFNAKSSDKKLHMSNKVLQNGQKNTDGFEDKSSLENVWVICGRLHSSQSFAPARCRNKSQQCKLHQRLFNF